LPLGQIFFMSDQLIRLIKLMEKTGDRLVIYDPSEKLAPYVLLDLEDYERLAENDPEQLLTRDAQSDKIKGEIEFWQDKDNFAENKPFFEELAQTEDQEEVIITSTDFIAESPEEPEVLENLPWVDSPEAGFDDKSGEEDAEDDDFEPNEASIIDAGFSPVGSILESRLAELQARLNK